MPKTIILIFTALFLFTDNSYSQISSGDILIEGTITAYQTKRDQVVSINSSSEIVTTKTQVQFVNPKVGFSIDNNLMLFIGTAYERLYSEIAVFFYDGYEIEGYEEYLFHITPGLRQYITLNDKFFLFNELNVLGGIGRIDTDYNSGSASKSRLIEFETNLNHGISYFISESLVISASTRSLYYTFRRQSIDDTDLKLNTSSFGLNNVTSLGLSIAVKF